MQYEYKTKPFNHQKELFERTKDEPAYALFWEQGCGKTKPVIDTCSYQFLKGNVDALLVVAPNGVHRNWITDELPAHMPDEILNKAKTVFWNSKKAKNKSFKAELKQLMKHNGLIVLTVNFEGFMTIQAKKFIWEMFQKRNVFFALDEGHNIKEMKAKRTISILAASKYPAFKRLMTGTPVAKGPFDLYSQVKFLYENFWKERRMGSFFGFKQFFGVWLTAAEVRARDGYDPGYDQLLHYKNIEVLEGMLSEVGDRLTKEDAGLDLPPKLFSKRYFDMTPEQQHIYDTLRDEYIVELEEGEYIEATLAIVRLLRLQQITCNYVVTDIDEPVRMISDKNPRLNLLKETIDGLEHGCIIWARFVKDIDQIMELLGDRACRYDGQVDDDEKAESKRAFQAGEKQFFVANPAAGSTGLTLTQARTVIYYSNNFKLVDRLQSEDRAHRIGQEHPVNYIDIVCPNTIDEKIISSLRDKYDIAAKITGDELKEWL